MIRHLIFLALTILPFNSHAFDEKLKECRASYKRFFPHCIDSFDQQRCLWEGLTALRKSDVFGYRKEKGDPITEIALSRYKRTREYRYRLKSLKRDRAKLPRATFCFLEPNLIDYNDDIKVWRYDRRNRKLKALLRGVNQDVLSHKSYPSGFAVINLKPLGDINEPLFFSVDRFIGSGVEELLITHTKIFVFFKIRSVRLKTYPNYEHPRYLPKSELKEEAERSGVSVKELTSFLLKETSVTSKHIEVTITDILLCEDEYSDEKCADPFPLRVSSKGRVY